MSAKQSKIIVYDKVYVPFRDINEEVLVKYYEKRFYDDQMCRKCEYLPDRHSYICDTCAGYKDHVRLHNVKMWKEKKYIGLPIGDKKNIERKMGIDFADYKIDDRRNTPVLNPKIKITIEPFPYQEKLIKEYVKKGAFGFLVAPPRSGKTFMMLAIIVKLGYRAILLASQHEFLQQFIWHIEGNEAEGIPKCTNLPELQAKSKVPLYGFPKTESDYENMQIMCMTYQTFISEKGQAKLKKLIPHVGTLAIDEADQGNAKHFSRVISRVPAKHKMAATGTFGRKDKKHYILQRVVGPVLAESTVEMVTPTVYIHPTGLKPRHHHKMWVYAMQWLCKNEKRNKMIVDQVIKDWKNGHNIVIPVVFKNHVKQLVDAINIAAGEPIAEGFTGGGGKKNKEDRKELLSRVKAGQTKVTVGIRKLVQRGLNVKQWSCIYTILPISNEPNYKQETSRIRTPLKGKNTPIVRLFYDEMGQSSGCAKNCVKQMHKFKFNFSTLPKQQEKLRQLVNSGRKVYDEDDEYKAVNVLGEAQAKQTLNKVLGTKRL